MDDIEILPIDYFIENSLSLFNDKINIKKLLKNIDSRKTSIDNKNNAKKQLVLALNFIYRFFTDKKKELETTTLSIQRERKGRGRLMILFTWENFSSIKPNTTLELEFISFAHNLCFKFNKGRLRPQTFPYWEMNFDDKKILAYIIDNTRQEIQKFNANTLCY